MAPHLSELSWVSDRLAGSDRAWVFGAAGCAAVSTGGDCASLWEVWSGCFVV